MLRRAQQRRVPSGPFDLLVGRIQGGGEGGVCNTLLNIPKMPHFFKFFGGVPPDPSMTEWSTRNPPFVLV